MDSPLHLPLLCTPAWYHHFSAGTALFLCWVRGGGNCEDPFHSGLQALPVEGQLQALRTFNSTIRNTAAAAVADTGPTGITGGTSQPGWVPRRLPFPTAGHAGGCQRQCGSE